MELEIPVDDPGVTAARLREAERAARAGAIVSVVISGAGPAALAAAAWARAHGVSDVRLAAASAAGRAPLAEVLRVMEALLDAEARR